MEKFFRFYMLLRLDRSQSEFLTKYAEGKIKETLPRTIKKGNFSQMEYPRSLINIHPCPDPYIFKARKLSVTLHAPIETLDKKKMRQMTLSVVGIHCVQGSLLLKDSIYIVVVDP